MNRLLFLFVACGIFCNTYAQSGLIAHWDFNGESNDITGHGHTGRALNTIDTTGITGARHTEYYFNGINSIVTAPYMADLNLNKYAICAIIKPTGLYQGNCLTNTVFARGAVNTGTGRYNLWFTNVINECYTSDTTSESFGSEAGTNVASPSLTAFDHSPYITKNTWYKIVANYDSTNWKIFVNGIQIDSVAGQSIPIGTTTDSISIGMSSYDAPAGYPYNFKGFIDDVRLYNRPLTDSEIVHYGDTCGVITSQPTSVRVHSIGSSTTFITNSTVASAIYQWQADPGTGFANLTNAGPYSGVTTPTLTVSGIVSSMSNYVYRCLVSNSYGCSDTSNNATLTVALGIDEITNNNDIHLYPNPAKNELIISAANYTINSVCLVNVYGQAIFEHRYNNQKINLDISALPSGLYVIKINGDIIKRFLKE